jgi:hypothetical protein
MHELNLKTGAQAMTNNVLKYGALLIALLAPIGAHAQGIVGGAADGADRENADAGPVGAVVGAVTGAVGGLLGVDQRPRFREYVVREQRPSYQYRDDVRVGSILPAEGIPYYDVPEEYGVRGDRYAVLNGQAVLVDPRTHRIIQIVD